MTYELVRHELVSLSSCRHSELVLPWPPLISYPLVPSSYPVCVTRHAGHGSRTTRTLTRVAAASRPALVPGLHRYGPRGPTPSPREPTAQMSSATRSCRRLLLRTLTTGGQVGGRPPVFGGSAARAPPMQVTSSFLPGSAPSAAAFSTSSATTRPSATAFSPRSDLAPNSTGPTWRAPWRPWRERTPSASTWTPPSSTRRAL